MCGCRSCSTLTLLPLQGGNQDHAVCPKCRPPTSLRRVAEYVHHQGVAKDLVRRVKYERARAGIDEMAALLAGLVPARKHDVLITHVPTATSRVRSRGYDHARLLAHGIARRSGLPCRPLLGRLGQAHQVGSKRAERLRQLHEAFRPLHPDVIRGRYVVLVDDVLTTGATLETAARVSKRAAAISVDAIVFFQA